MWLVQTEHAACSCMHDAIITFHSFVWSSLISLNSASSVWFYKVLQKEQKASWLFSDLCLMVNRDFGWSVPLRASLWRWKLTCDGERAEQRCRSLRLRQLQLPANTELHDATCWLSLLFLKNPTFHPLLLQQQGERCPLLFWKTFMNLFTSVPSLSNSLVCWCRTPQWSNSLNKDESFLQPASLPEGLLNYSVQFIMWIIRSGSSFWFTIQVEEQHVTEPEDTQNKTYNSLTDKKMRMGVSDPELQRLKFPVKQVQVCKVKMTQLLHSTQILVSQ